MNEIEFINITKEFSGFYANKNINLAVKKGTVHALVGENGAGKSTLMSILFGIYEPTSGIIKIKGNPTIIKNPSQASDIGIGMVHQHFKLVDVYTNLENIILGSEFTKAGNILDLNKSKIKIEIFQKTFNLNFDLNQKTGEATVATQQKVEIMKMLYRDADILIFDEPTAVLTPQEIDELLKVIEFLKQKGKTIIFISHKLWEVKKIADEVTVIRHGQVVKHYPSLKNISISTIANDMVGKHIVEAKNTDHSFSDEVVFKLENITFEKLKNVNLEVRKGEIVAIAGVEGNGQEELEQIITGIRKPENGKIIINNRNGEKDITSLGVKKKNKEFISVIPADRHKHGLVLDYTISENSIIRRLEDSHMVNKFTKIIKRKNQNKFSQEITDLFDVRGTNEGTSLARTLSGGNQQKAIIGREILTDHDFLLVVQPTRGLDIGAINYIHKQIIDEKAKQKAVILISYELDEVISLADTIAVINKGEILGKGPIDSFTREQIGLLMAGIKQD